MFSRQDGQEVPEWTLLGTFAGGEVAFVRELLQAEVIPHREESRLGQDGAMHSELWVASPEHARALALLAEAQSEAEAAAYRETAALTAERERTATEEARAAAAEALATAASARRAKRKAARRAAKEAARGLKPRRLWRSRQAPMPLDPSEADRGVRLVGSLLAALILAFVLITVIGERYGTRSPAPAHDDKTVACHSRYWGICP